MRAAGWHRGSAEAGVSQNSNRCKHGSSTVGVGGSSAALSAEQPPGFTPTARLALPVSDTTGHHVVGLMPAREERKRVSTRAWVASPIRQNRVRATLWPRDRSDARSKSKQLAYQRLPRHRWRRRPSVASISEVIRYMSSCCGSSGSNEWNPSRSHQARAAGLRAVTTTARHAAF